jgi:glycosyltransferase involved in cell wall biosynthesis
MEEPIQLAFYATREAAVKLGGVGTVLESLLSADAYVQQVQRTILVGPMFTRDRAEMARLQSPQNGLTIFYSSLHGIFDGVDEAVRSALQGIEQTFQVALLYGKRKFGQYEHEVLLADATQPALAPLQQFQTQIGEHYGVDLRCYSWSEELIFILATAQPLFAACHYLVEPLGLTAEQKRLILMGWPGIPLLFAMQIATGGTNGRWAQTLFYADECATARHLVEDHEGHDTRFYNVLTRAQPEGITMTDLFGRRDDLFKHTLLQQAVHCDRILAVGDFVIDELRFLGGGFRQAEIAVVYCGIPAQPVSRAEKAAAKARLQDYCQTLLGYRPDYILTHVARVVPSKAIWRDLRVLHHLEHLLRKAGQSAVFFMLGSSDPAGRLPEQVLAWETAYGWPVVHHTDNGDLFADEISLFQERIQPFNKWSKQCKALLINQFGWSRARCGQRMPEAMSFRDIRIGADVEFGQSIYEPFGIAQLEALSAGTLCCVSNICGCTAFVQQAVAQLSAHPRNSRFTNVVVADYVSLPPGSWLHRAHDAIHLDKRIREWVEQRTSAKIAQILFTRLPKNEAQVDSLLAQGQMLAAQMSWEVVVKEQFLPALANIRP